MTARSQQMAERIVVREGGYWNDPGAGPTNFGIVQSTLNRLRSRPRWVGLPANVRDLKREQAVEIIRVEYVEAQKAHLMLPMIGEVIADTVVMSWDDGVRILQKLLGFEGKAIDGIVGKNTIGRSDQIPAFLDKTIAGLIVREFLDDRKGKQFIGGWSNRLHKVLEGEYV